MECTQYYVLLEKDGVYSLSQPFDDFHDMMEWSDGEGSDVAGDLCVL